MTQLETLSLHFLSLPPRRNYLGLLPPPGDRVVLPALTRFKYRGISKYLDNFSSSLSSVEDLNIETNEPPNVPHDMDDEQWLRPEVVRTFDGTKDLHVHGELTKDILHALCPGEEEHKIVFPSLRNLYVQERISMQGPLRGSLESFVTQRQLSGHPVEIHDVGLPSLQRTIQTSKLPPLSEDRFKVLFTQFTNTTGLRLNDRDFVFDGRPVNLWALHRAVFARNGFESVTANDEWPTVGAALGFPLAFPPTQPLRCAPAIAYRLQQLYNDCLRHFEQAYLNNIIARLESSQALVSAQASQQ